jgi:electron transport complex protein RnfB
VSGKAIAADSANAALVDRIDALLPQTQCTKCSYSGCRPYAEAIERGEAEINRCPPGGEAGIRALAALLGRAPLPLDPTCGAEGPRRVAVIDEARCIGCALCLHACPVDAIAGAAKHMHTVITALCSGCDLCLPPCPVDCIEMVPAKGNDALWDRERADAARHRFERRNSRLARERTERRAHPSQRDASRAQRKRATVQAAIDRARAKKAAAQHKR